MSFDDFINKYNGKSIDYDHAFSTQCVDLMNQYVTECLGFNLQGLGGDTAYHIYQNASNPNFTKIGNTPTGVPLKGDIMFFFPNTAGQTGSAGHVSIFESGDVYKFVSFDQNYPTGTLCHSQNHDYQAVAGWLHPKTIVVPPVHIPDSEFRQKVKDIILSSDSSDLKVSKIKALGI